MNAPDPSSPGKPSKDKPVPEETKPGGASPAPAGDPSSDPPEDLENLSPEEQMARYEESLKDTDWGHQPC